MKRNKKNSDFQLDISNLIDNAVSNALVRRNPNQDSEDALLTLSDEEMANVAFRTAAPCATKGCQHFDGKDCRLAMRVVENLPKVVEDLPPCSIRRDCQWWQQEGKAACMRCPQVITDNYNPSELLVKVATPTVG
ncbi:MAG: hypothetical protein RMY64_24065 [Nostoc sp. DedQUE08]|uniref:hypothetical protein n=1 Tax=Nostoc sp. DedQUE08 TaxID=3075393 RepID=UPI002AD32F1A|nr:hypothetical protein [Nostoc sp. DedQUE08]MDZ8068670.1 hypothetical protein [Nostoc sp. DedQUE08]